LPKLLKAAKKKLTRYSISAAIAVLQNNRSNFKYRCIRYPKIYLSSSLQQESAKLFRFSKTSKR